MKILGEMRYYSVCSIISYYKNDALSFVDTCHSMHSSSNKDTFTSRTWIKKCERISFDISDTIKNTKYALTHLRSF